MSELEPDWLKAWKQRKVLLVKAEAPPVEAPRDLRAEAKAEGKRFFFTGKPCVHGHIVERYVTGGACKECIRARYAANREDNLARSRAWQEANPERARELERRWREANGEKVRSYQRKWKEADPDRARANWRRARAKEREVYPERVRADLRAYQAAKLSSTPPWADMDAIKAVYAEAERLTQATGVLHHVDHIVPLQGETVCGLHIAINLQPLPTSENLRKNNRHWPGMW